MTMTEIKNYLTLNLIQAAVVNYYEISLNKLITSKLKKVSEARNIAIYLCRQFTSLPAETIGQAFGGKDHASVICALYRIEENLKNNCLSTIESLEKLGVTADKRRSGYSRFRAFALHSYATLRNGFAAATILNARKLSGKFSLITLLPKLNQIAISKFLSVLFLL